MKQLLFWLIFSGLAVPALAHSVLDHSDPKNGATLKHGPNEIRMWFTEPLKTSLSTIEVHDDAGKQVDRRDLHADGKQPTLMHLSLEANLRPGVYKVSWAAVAEDLHVSKGSLTFRISP